MATLTYEHRALTAAEARRHVASADRRTRIFNRCCTGVLIAFAILWLVPLAWALDTALKPNGDTVNPTWLIENPTLESFRALLAQGDILNWYAASFITSAAVAA